MRRVTKENLIAQIDRLYKMKDEQGQLSMNGEYTLQAYEMLLATMEAEPVAYIPKSQLDLLKNRVMVEADLSKVRRFDEIPLYRHAEQPVAEVIQKLNGYDRPLYVVAIEGNIEEGDVLYRHAQP